MFPQDPGEKPTRRMFQNPLRRKERQPPVQFRGLEALEPRCLLSAVVQAADTSDGEPLESSILSHAQIDASTAGVPAASIEKINIPIPVFGEPRLGLAARFASTGLDDVPADAYDRAGNVYKARYFDETVDVDPGRGKHNLTSAGGYDIYITKLDGDGNLLWAIRIGSTGWDMPRDLAVDDAGNVIVTGAFNNTVDFDPGEGTCNLISTGGVDNSFIAKYDTDGNLRWARKLHSSNNSNIQSTGLDADRFGTIYVSGDFFGTPDFDPGVQKFNLKNKRSSSGFVSMFDTDGNFLWARQLGWSDYLVGRDVAVDSRGNAFVTGYSIDDGRDYNAFVAKIDAGGRLRWKRKIGGPDYDSGAAIVVGRKGNVFVKGEFTGTVDFDPGLGTKSLTSGHNGGTYVAKFDTGGKLLWARRS